MPKLSKGKLKEIIKECLVEILTEGISASSSSGQTLIESSRKNSASQLSRAKRVKANPALDNVRFNNAVEEQVNSLTQDPMMASIFADTARTTLQEQTQAEGRRGMPSAMGDSAARTVAANNLEDMFGENTQNWASIAFADTPPK